MSHLATDRLCAYCRKRRDHQTDHLITSNQARRNHTAARERENPKYKVRACSFCNQAKGTLLRVPPSKAHLLMEMNALTGGVYGIFDGSAENLREVVK